jgi:hypothetical protein
MECPFIEEIIMMYCRAYPVRKPVPRHRITTETPCMDESHVTCPVFKEVVTRLQSSTGEGQEEMRGRERQTERR